MGSSAGSDRVVLKARHLRKTFPGVVANDDVSLTLRGGTIHAVMGENGAGKSTLMNLLFGSATPDSGTIAVNGQEVTFTSPRDALALGIGMVHQHFMLADNLTVLENVILGAEPTKGGRINRVEATQMVMTACRQLGVMLDPAGRIGDMSVADRQRVEIIKVLALGARVIIMDEPTTVLVPTEVAHLFASLRKLLTEGLSIVFVSHKLDEVLDLADEITVIRRGRSVAESLPVRDVDKDRLTRLMIGSELASPVGSRHDTAAASDPTLVVRGLTLVGYQAVPRIDLEVRPGEIVGIAGVEGNGQSELVEVLAGVSKPAAGDVVFGGQPVTAWPSKRRRRAGVAVIPEDRHRHGLLLGAPLWENRALGWHQLRPNSRRGLITRQAARHDTRRLMQQYDVRSPDETTSAGALSGGNQQKLIVGRELASNPALLIAAHPTRGVDVSAQVMIWQHIHQHIENGMAMVLISADIDELLTNAHRVLVMFRGTVVAEIDPERTDPVELGLAMTGAGA